MDNSGSDAQADTIVLSSTSRPPDESETGSSTVDDGESSGVERDVNKVTKPVEKVEKGKESTGKKGGVYYRLTNLVCSLPHKLG